MRVAVPSSLPGGLDAAMSGHFGHCEAFTIITLEDAAITGVEISENGQHESCGAPVRHLAEVGVEALIVGGIGMRPLDMLRGQGIGVFVSRAATVREAVRAFTRGDLPKFDDSLVCGGSHGPGGCQGHK
ncbi:MAG: NifB/NifX family molybdenum-iron cluster-binding protein [Pseudomonadota bacterium]